VALGTSERLAETSEESTGRRRVLDAAAEQFVAHGYAGTTLRQIAADAGIKAGSIYHHFDSKEALFIAVLDDGISVMLQAFAATSDSVADDSTTHDQLLAHVRAHLSAVFENGPYTTAHVTSFFSAPTEVRKQVVPIRDGYEQQWNNLFAELFPTVAPKTLRLHRVILFGAMNASAEWFDPGGDISVQHLASAITGQFLNGLNGLANLNGTTS